MNRSIHSYMIVLAILSTIAFSQASPSYTTETSDWPFEIQVQHKPGAYWWSPGSAWDLETIDWNLKTLSDGGIGTIHIIPIYGARGYEERYIPFLSDEWVSALDTILETAESLGIQVDMTTGTGWCFGGPGLDESQVDIRAQWNDDESSLALHRSRMVKRAAPGGEGNMLNPYSREAMNAYLQRFNEALGALERLPRSQYHDSFEYNANWHGDMPDEFRTRRGYDITRHLETIFGEAEDNDTTRRIKYDYRLTINELHQEYIQAWSDWASGMGMLTRNQAHGAPANLLDVYALADIPETEIFGSPEFPIPGFRHDDRFCRPGDSDPRICKMASSAAHVAHQPGSQLVSSESCTWMREHWHGTLGQIKLEMELLFLAGVNHVFYHGSCYSPKDVPWPGWFFYASTKADWRNSIWRDMPYLNQFLARCQSMLQAGRPSNDILLYWPIHDLWMDAEGILKNLTVHSHGWMDDASIGAMANQLDANGYAYDFVSDRMLESIQFENGKLIAPGGTYQCIVVPQTKYIPAKTLQRLAELSLQGAPVFFEESLPDDVPGHGELNQRRDAFNQAKASLNKTIIDDDIIAALNQADIRCESEIVEHGLRYIRRVIEGEQWYFIANHSNQNISGWLTLDTPFSSATLHDPMTGRSFKLPVKSNSHQILLEIKAGESFIVQTSEAEIDAHPYLRFVDAEPSIELTGKWQVEFIDGAPAFPDSYTTASLSSWTDWPDAKTRAFAGTAKYTLRFDLAKDERADEYRLDLGDVRESARVYINGEEAAVLFALPMSCLVGQHLKDGSNTIELEVTNLSANRIRDMERRGLKWKIMRDANIVTPLYETFDASDWPLKPSGLLGPITLTPLNET